MTFYLAEKVSKSNGDRQRCPETGAWELIRTELDRRLSRSVSRFNLPYLRDPRFSSPVKS